MTGASIAMLKAWVDRTLGESAELDLIPGGGSRTSFIVRGADGTKYILRQDNGQGPLSGTGFSLEREYRVISALHGTGLRVPGIVAYSADMNAMLMTFVDSAAICPPEHQPAVQRDLMQQVIMLHSLHPDTIGLRDFGALDTVRKAMECDLSILKGLYDRPGILKDPAVDFALRWLADHIPDPDSRAAIVHGDIGPGNFLFDSHGQVVALIDWEVVHMGHPLEDLAAVLCRSLGTPFGTAQDHIRNFEQITGQAIDRATLDAMVILVLTRWTVGLNLGLSHRSIHQNLPVILSFRQSVSYTLVCMLAKVHGLVPRPLEQVVRDPAAAVIPVHDYMVHTLEAVIGPALPDPYFAACTGGLAALVKYLRDLDIYGADRLEREEKDAIESLLGAAFSTRDAAMAAICDQAGQLGEGADRQGLVACLLALSTRQQEIWANGMGDMAYRTMEY